MSDGDVLRFISYRWDEYEDDCQITSDLWAISIGVHDCIIILGGVGDGEDILGPGDQLPFNHRCDEWEVPPPEEWPDEVAVAVAAYRLMGEILIDERIEP